MLDKFPSTYTDSQGRCRQVTGRVPYRMSGEKETAAATQNSSFGGETFSHSLSEPFEIHGVRCHVTTLSAADTPQADPATLVEPWVKLTIKPRSASRALMSGAERLTTIFRYMTARYGEWDLDVPYTIETSQGFSVVVDNWITAGAAAAGIRTELVFWGYLLVLGAEVKG